MRITIQLGKNLFLFLLLLVMGSISTIYGVSSLHKERTALDIGFLDKEDCIKGAYVKGYITSCLTNRVDNVDFSISAEYGMFLVYYFITIPIKDNHYICVMLSDRAIVKKFKDINQEEEMEIYIEGEIVKSPTELSYEFYQNVHGIDSFEIDNIIPDYAIKQVNYGFRRKWMYAGISFLFCSFLTFIEIGGIKEIVVKKSGMETCFIHPRCSSYYKENEIVIEKKHLEKLKEEKRKLKNSAIYSLPVLALGVFIIKVNYFWEIKFIGIVISVACLKEICRYVFSLGWKGLEWMIQLFGRESISHKISKCEEKIAFLEKYMEQ